MKRVQRASARKARRGGALVAAVLVVMLVAGLSATMLQLSSASSRRHVAAIDQKKALYLAEAGLSEACMSLTLGKTGNVGTAQLPASFGEGLFWVEATDAGDGILQLRSTALCGTGRAALAIYVTADGAPVGSLGFFGEEELEVGAGATVDGFDSSEDDEGGLLGGEEGGLLGGGEGGLLGGGGELLGGLDEVLEPLEPAPIIAAQLGSNGDVELTGGVEATLIAGDVAPGLGGTVSIGTGVTVTGATLPRDQAADLPPVVVPTIASSGNLSVGALLPATITGERAYNRMLVRGGTLNLRGPATLVAGSLVLQSGATLSIDTTDGPVTIYVTSSIQVDATSQLANVGESATDCTLNVSGADGIDLDGDGDGDPAVTLLGRGLFYGFLYAPAAAVAIPQPLEVYGGVVSQSLAVAAGAQLHYDVALADPPPGTIEPNMLCWRLLELPAQLHGNWSPDPKRVLGLSRTVVLPKPADAHDQSLWGIKFIDTLGVTRKWVGVRSAFDWSRVQTVIWQGTSDDEAGWLANIGSLVGGLLGDLLGP